MVQIKTTLRAHENKQTLEGAALDPELRSTLERIAPIYRKYWWPKHRASNEAWITAMRSLLLVHGKSLADAVAAAYGEKWPAEPVPVDVTVTAGPNNAYTSSPPTHTTISSMEPSVQGFAALELLFH